MKKIPVILFLSLLPLVQTYGEDKTATVPGQIRKVEMKIPVYKPPPPLAPSLLFDKLANLYMIKLKYQHELTPKTSIGATYYITSTDYTLIPGHRSMEFLRLSWKITF